jgi:pimeloyl-ACP methyl ester carboxylesterase
MPNDAITPFILAVPQADLADLNRRIDQTRWPDKETVDDWTQGAPLAKVKALVGHWRHRYDWHRCEAMLSDWGQYKKAIDGLDIHFLQVRSKHGNALPLIITHGWPGSVIEFMKIIGPLTDPTAHGGKAEDAFHVIAPSLPGHGFSDKATETGWGIPRIPGAWITLMRRLGYTRWVAQGGDWSSVVTTVIGAMKPDHCAAIHVNMPLVFPEPDQLQGMDPFEQAAAVASLAHWEEKGSGYLKQQSTRPQTLGYRLADSPVGQAAWIYEKLWAWTDNQGNPEDALTLDEMLDNIILYWLSGTATSSAPAILGKLRHGRRIGQAGDSCRRQRLSARDPSPLWALGRSVDAKPDPLQHPGTGGHFAAWEQPALHAKEIRDCFAKVR